MKLFEKIAALLFPPKCVLCGKLLSKQETDLCHSCRIETPEYVSSHFSISFLAKWDALWYYEGNVRQSLLRYKFRNKQSYAEIYGRLLAMRLLQHTESFDILSWIPISAQRKRRRGYDQVELIAQAVSRELGMALVPTLQKIRNTPPQSGIAGHAKRKANVLGAYKALPPAALAGKRVLILDDIITTGATASECARVLLTAGTKEVICVAVAAVRHNSTKNSR